MEVGNNSKRLQELYDGLIKDNYDLNSIGRNIDEFAEKLATDTVFSNFVYDDLRSKTGFSGSKADFLVKALGSRVVPSSISKGRKTAPPYKPNKNEYVHFETPIKNVLGGGEKTAEDYAIDALEATGRATPMTGADKYRFQKNNVINSIGAEKVIEEAKTRKINKPQVDLSVVGKSILPDDIRKQEEQKQLQAIEAAKQNIEEEKAQRQMIDKTIGNVRERAQKEYNEYAEQLRKREEAIPYFVRGDKDAYISPINAELANSVPAATLQVIDDTEKLLNAPRKGSNWANSMWAGAKDAADAESFFTFGLSNIAKSATIKSVVDKYAAGGHLSKSEEDLMEALATNTLVAYLRKDDVSGWYTAGQIAEASAEIATQFLGTNVIGTAATKAISKGIGKFLSKNTPKLVAKMATKGLGGATLRGARFVGKGALDTFVGGTAQSLFMPNTYDSAIQTKTGTVAFGKGKGQYDVTPSEYNLAQSLVSGAIEGISERAGGAFAGFGGKVAKNIIPTSWGKLSSKGIVGGIIKAGGTANRYLSKAGINGQFGELAEEVFGQALNRINGTTTKEEWANFWSKDNMLQMIGGFAPMSLVGLGANTTSVAKSSLDAYRADRALLNFARQNNITAPKKMLDEIKNVEIENLHRVIEGYVQELGGVSDGKLNDIGVEFNKLAANVVVHNIRKDIYAEADSEISPAESVSTDERQKVTDENIQEERQPDYTIPQLRQGDEVEYDNAQWIVGDVADEDGDYQVGEESIPLRRGNVLLLGADGESVQVIDSVADLYPEQQNVDNEMESKRQAVYEQYRPVMNIDTGNITQLSNVAGTDNIAYVVKGKVVYDEDGNIDYDKSDDTIYYKVYDKDGNEVDGGTPKPIYLKTRRTEFGKVLSDVPIEEYVDNELYPQEQNNIQQAINNGPTNIEQSTPAESVTPNEYQEVTEENDSTEFDENGGYSNIQNTVLSDEEADLLMSAMEQNAEAMPAIELTPDNWVAEFGQNGTVSTPIGDVKMGDNQLAKLFLKKRTREFGMIKPTLVNPDVIIEKTSVADNAERNTKLLFVKTFKDENGQKHVHFENVTVKKGGLEVSISSHIVDKSAIRKELANGIVIYNKPELTSIGSDVYLTETHEGQSDLVPTQKANSDLQYKGTTNNLNEQGEFYNSLPRNKKGEVDESQMSAEQKIMYAQIEFGQRADLVRDYVSEQSKALSEKIAKLTNKTGKSVAEYKELAAMQEDKNVFVEYLNEQRQQQEQATPRRTVEEAAAEREERRAAEKEQREQAIREKEEREGVPDFMQDTPEDARLRGFRLRTGERIDRQEPITLDRYNTARRKFTNDTGAVEGGRPTVKRTIIDNAQTKLQPSHRGGRSNIYHFITEAQPKERTDKASRVSAAQIAANINPEEITGGITAYNGSPIANNRLEVIQGNNRAEALRLMYEEYPKSAEAYKQYLIDNAENYGMSADEVRTMKEPIAVDIYEGTDGDAILLGQYTQQDVESGGVHRINPSGVIKHLKSQNMLDRFITGLLKGVDEENTVSDVISANLRDVLPILDKTGAISMTQRQGFFDERGDVTSGAIDDFKGILTSLITEGGYANINSDFLNLPDSAKTALYLQTYRAILNQEYGQQILGEIQDSILLYTLVFGNNNKGKVGVDESRREVMSWLMTAQPDFNAMNEDGTYPLVDMREKFSNFAAELAILYKSTNLRSSKDKGRGLYTIWDDFYNLLEGKGDLFTAGERKSLQESINENFNIDYVPIRQNEHNTLGSRGEASRAGRRGSKSELSVGEQSEAGTSTADDRGRAEADIAEAVKDIDVEPTEAQKKAGNYKKGHVKIQGFDITIENPKGAIRRGVDDNGKAWSTEMKNHYGYFKNTEGKDGDHIDVFIGDNPNSKRIFVVDQVNPKTKEFDESKVMLGFDTEDEAKKAYLSNYSKDWKGFKDITYVDIDTFRDWLYDGAKQRKPFGEYSNIRLNATEHKAQETTTEKLEELVTLLKKTGFADVKTGEDFYNALAEIEDKEGSRFMIGKQATESDERAIADETADIKAKAIADGTFMKAPNGKDTNLTERQWLQVRTKAFKRWFGDWENAYKLELIENLQPIDVDNKGLSRERAEEEYKKIGTSKTNRYDNRRIEFVNNAFGKIARHKNSALILDIIPQLNDLFESAIPIYFEEEREPLKSTNIVGSHNYLGKVRVNDEDYYVRITAQELTPSWKQNEKQGKSNFHNMAVSDIAIYDESGSSVTAKDYSIDNDNRNRFVDAKLQHFFETAREARENSSKVVDENGEPMVVYHGTDTRASFNKFKGAVHFFTENKDIAGDFGVDASMDKVRKGRDFSEYADEKGYLGYKIYETFLSLQNPFIVDADNSEWDEIKTPKEMGGKGAKTTDQIGRWAKRNGYGGVVIKNTIDANSHIPISQYIAFNPTQIKSATDNIGTFDEEDEDIRYMRPNGTVLGFVKGNTIYLNPDEVSLNTPIHEFGHLWVSQVKEHFPDLWAKGKELFLESDYLRKVQADENYRHLDLDGQIDEAMARAIGDRGEQELDKTLLEKILDWIAEVWDKIGGVFGIDNLTSEQISNLTLQDFTDMATSELLSGQNLTERVNGNRGGATRYNTADETADIKAKAIADGTFMKAPNGKDTNLTERQWLQVRTKAFKRWFGDWEKAARIEKLKKTKPIEITGEEVKPSDDLKEYKKNALEYGKTLQGEYTNKDTGITIQLQRGRKNGGLNEVLQHDYKDREHLQSIAAIPQIIENATYIDSEPNNDIPKNPDVKEYQYYVCGLKIGGEDYTVRAVVAVDNKGNRYYDHKLTNIEKGKLLDQINSQAIKNNGFGTTPGTKPTTVVSEYKDSKLISLLQENSSKVVDENGEPMVVYHGTWVSRGENYDKWNPKKEAPFYQFSESDNGIHFGTEEQAEYIIARKRKLFEEEQGDYTGFSHIYASFLNIRNVYRTYDAGLKWDKVISKAKSNGYDGLVYGNTHEGLYKKDSYVVFHPTQIKSATDNIGTFDGEDGDIRYMLVNVQDEKAIDEERRRPKFEIKGEDVYTTMYTTRADTETEIDVLYNGNDFEKALSEAEGYNENSDREDLKVSVEAMRLKIPIAAIKEEYDYDDEEYDGDVAPFVEDYIDDFVENVDYDRYETGRDMFDVYKSKPDTDEHELIGTITDKLQQQTGLYIGKYSTFYITKNGEMTDEEADKDGVPNAFVSMRIADHTHNRHNGDSTLNIVIADDDPTKTKFQSSKEDLRYTTKDNAEEIVKDILDFWRQYAREYFGDINKQFNDDLDEFERNRLLSSRKFNLGRPSPILMSAGLNGVSIQMTQSVLRKHLDKHNLKTDDLRELPEAIRTPIMVYEWGDKARNSVIVTSIPRGEERITTTIRLTRDGNKLNVNEISSIYGKSAERLIRDINTPKSEFGKDNLRYVDKKQVLDWFAMEAPKASSQTQQELITATKVIENFENPPINEKKVIDDTTNDMVRYSIRANDQLDREDEIMGKKAAEIYEARVKLRKQMNQSDPKKMPNKEIFDDLSRKTEAKRMKFVETVADQYRAVKSFVDTLNEHGYNISDYNNWYMNVFALAGKNEAEFEKYQAERSKPLQRAAKAAMDSGNISYRELENYLILKHGQERNEYFTERDKGLGIEPLKDYSGVEAVMFEEFCKRTGIEVKTQKESVPQLAEANNNIDILYTDGVSEFSENGRKLPIFEVERRFAEWKKVNDLQSIIADYEQKIGKDKIDDLWAKINYATQFVLDMQKAGGLTSEKMYEKASGMWKYFVPLRGFDVGTAKDEFDYDLNGVVLFTDFKVEPTLGRTRRSTSPLVWTEQMAHITIDQKNRNLLNQSLRRLASISMARRDNILLLSKLYKDVDTKDEVGRTIKGEVKYPPKYTGDTEHDAKAYADWTAEMKAGIENGTIEEVRQDNVNFGKIVPPAAVKQHIVRVYEGGVPTDVIFNTPPAVPRAINGLNHRTSIGNAWLLRQAKAGTRLMAQSMTTLNPAFVGKNFTRDYLFANAMLVGRENADYVKNFNANVVKAAPILMSYVRGNSLLGWAGKNIKNDKYGGWLTEFVMNGGKTGFSQMLKFEKMSKDFRRQTERGDKTIHYGLNDYMNFIEAINDFAENITRFSAYCASRQAGRSIERSISDAKELTINFNRHGTMGGIWGEFKALSAFANASIQALLVFYRGIKANPKRVSAIISGYVAMPIAMSIMARLVGGDDSDYFKLSKYDRQNNLCLPLFGGGFVKIPLPQELRVFYKLGDEIALSVWNNEPIDMATQEVLMGALDLLPSFASGATSIGDVTGGKMSTGEFIGAHNPITVLQPATQIISNRNFLNYRIYDDNKWGGRKAQLPEYRKALRNKGGETYSPNFVVKLSEGISRLTGGSDLKRGVVEVNPDVINHLMRGYFGGLYSSAVAAINMGDKGAQSIAAGEIKMKTTDSPTMKAFYVSPSNLRYTDDILNARYMNILKEAKKHANVYANYLKEGELDRFEKETKMTEDEALDWRYLVKTIDKEVQELRNEIATAETTKERDEALRQLEALQREVIDMAAKLKK